MASGDGVAEVAVVRKRFQNLKHHYEVFDMVCCPGAEAAGLLPDILRNPSLPKLKHIYSQDRRPRKTVRERPWLLFHAATCPHDTLAGLQHCDIAVKRIRIQTEMSSDGEKEGEPSDYAVEMADLVKRLANAVSEQRLDVVDDCPDAIILRRDLEIWHTSASNTLKGRLLALALPVWFRETILYRRTYRSV